MDGYNFYMAKEALPGLREMERVAAEYGKRYNKDREPELYRLTHTPGIPEEEVAAARKELTETSMCLVFQFLNNFHYWAKQPEVMEDLVQRGFEIIMKGIDKWDITRGSFRAMVNNSLQILYRDFYKEMSMRPQTGIQEDAKIKAYDNECIMKNGAMETAEQVANALGRSEKSVQAARNRLYNRASSVESLDKMQEMSQGADILAERGYYADSTEPTGILNEEFIKEAREVLKKSGCKYEDRLIFDFLMTNDNYDLPNNELSEVIKNATGYDFSYQQLYRAKQSIGATLMYHGLLSRSWVKGNVKWIDQELERMYEAEQRKKNKYAFLWK